MKNIIPALNKIQLACMDKDAPLSDLGRARKELFAAIKEAANEAALAAAKDTASCAVESMPKSNLLNEWFTKFDKLNSD